MFHCPEDIALEMARIEREARRAVLDKIAARQLGEAWAGLGAVEDVHSLPLVERQAA
jgi:hypothetical protein